MWAIKSGEYYLSNKYEKAAEMVLGYGGVWSKNDMKLFRTKREALNEIRKMQYYGTGRDAEPVRIVCKK